MKINFRLLTGFSLLMLLLCLVFGIISIMLFFDAGWLGNSIHFQQARPFHVSAALFWIITAAVSGLLFYSQDDFNNTQKRLFSGFIHVWTFTIVAVFIFYSYADFGGREYWEFPPFLNIFILIAWILLLAGLFKKIRGINKTTPAYVWSWMTGVIFFLFTFTEQNLWQIPWFRTSFLKEMTIQWKSNGSMVGAWNQMIYGSALYLMVKISGDESIGRSKKAYFAYLLGLTNLIFNWGHHIYNVPGSTWVRDVSYAISMTEWIFIITIIQGFKIKLEERNKFRHLVPYRFLIAAEFWIFMNLLLALMMSIPAINRYTHGTHITVAHAMGTTIGINTMVLLGSLSYMLSMEQFDMKIPRDIFNFSYWTAQASFLVFWLSLIAAGIMKGINMANSPGIAFTQLMEPVYPYLKLVMFSGILLSVCLIAIVILLFRKLKNV